MFKGNYEG